MDTVLNAASIFAVGFPLLLLALSLGWILLPRWRAKRRNEQIEEQQIAAQKRDRADARNKAAKLDLNVLVLWTQAKGCTISLIIDRAWPDRKTVTGTMIVQLPPGAIYQHHEISIRFPMVTVTVLQPDGAIEDLPFNWGRYGNLPLYDDFWTVEPNKFRVESAQNVQV